MLSQPPEDYYTYGELDRRSDKRAHQYFHPAMLSAILRDAFEWQAINRRRFGVGYISLSGGRPHTVHA